MRIMMLIIATALSLGAYAQSSDNEAVETVDSITPPPPADPYASTEPADEESVDSSEGLVIEEFRIQGRLDQVQVTPKNAATMYLFDRKGPDPYTDTTSDIDSNVNLPKWKLIEW